MILLLALLGGGLGLPLFDVVAYHSRPAACRPLGPTLAEQGGVRAHPQVCVLPNATAASGALPVFTPALLPPAARAAEACAPLVGLPILQLCHSLCFSRAPPTA
jgi:hypothetical protein